MAAGGAQPSPLAPAVAAGGARDQASALPFDPESPDGRPPPPQPHRRPGEAVKDLPLPPSRHPALLKPLPTLGGRDWNVERCYNARKCDRQGCRHYHSDAEKRSKDFETRPMGQVRDDGLQVHLRDVRQVLAVDMSSTVDLVRVSKYLQGMTASQRAVYIRAVVFGFQGCRMAALKKILEQLPLVHEIVLPDRPREANLLVLLADLVEDLALTAPRLQTVVFEDASLELLWT